MRAHLWKISIAIAAIGLISFLLVASGDPLEAARSYLWAYIWATCLPLGSLAFLMIYHTTGGRWSEPVMSLARQTAATTPFLILLFLPLGLAAPHLYPWAQPEIVAAEPVWQHRAAYMNLTGFWWRSLGALVIWSYLAWRMQQKTSTPKLQTTASVGLALHLFLTGMVSVDWLLSLNLHFASTIYGFLITVLQASTAFALLTAAACWREASHPRFNSDCFYDLGGLLLAQVMLVGYLSFSQLVIIWSGNLPHEIGWLQSRVWGSWKWMALALLLVQLFFPFLCLIWGGLKRRVRVLGSVAALVAALSPVHFFWLIIPTFHPHEIPFHLGTACLGIMVAGLWGAALSRTKGEPYEL